MICGHKKQQAFLQGVIDEGIAHHAFLFAGPSAVGKRTIAEAFAAALIAKDDITKHVRYRDPSLWRDILVIAPQKHTSSSQKTISIDDIRTLQKQLALTSDSSMRVVIIHSLDRATPSAQNALLKIIEEPQAQTRLIITSSYPQTLLSTIHSRVLRLDFGLVTTDDLKQFAKEETSLVSLAMGRPGIFMRLKDDHAYVERMQQAQKSFKELSTMSVAERLAFAENLAKQPEKINEILDVWLWQVHEAAHKHHMPQLLLLAQKILRAQHDLRTTNVHPRLRVEELLLHL